MNPIRRFLNIIRSSGIKRSSVVSVMAMGREHKFEAYDVGDDTFIFERGISAHLGEHTSVLTVTKRNLGRKAKGWVLTMSTGNHAVAAFPLLDGRFWKLSALASAERGQALMNSIVCSNVVGDKLEVSQREVSTQKLIAADEWLTGDNRFSMVDVQMLERNEETLDYYRHLGQEWRVKPLAWTATEMIAALAASKKRIGCKISYYHSARGVHFLTLPEFRRFAALVETNPDEFLKGLHELVGVFEGQKVSFCRQPKHRGHHEIEFFGVGIVEAQLKLVPAIEELLAEVTMGKLGHLGVIQKTEELLALYESLLTRAEFSDESAREFTEHLYMHITGEIYSTVGGGSTPAFDDRRTALPGGTFVDGRIVLHPGADSRSEVLLSNLRGMLSKGEFLEYANVYELREDDSTPLGKGHTREVVYKTNMRPLETSLIEKGLSSRRKGYADYVLARVGALRAMGVTLSGYYRLLRRRAGSGAGMKEFYIRLRCEGEPIDSIPANYYHTDGNSNGEDPEVVLALATLMGDAAAQNMAMKKFDPRTESPLFGVGKEIYEFEYNLARERMVPKTVSTCSVRGSFGWPDLEYSDLNFKAVTGFYLTHFAHALKLFQRQHQVPMLELAQRFMDGFEFRTHSMNWHLSVMRDKFETFSPPVARSYNFAAKWKFIMWSMEQQNRNLARLRKVFFEKVRVEERLAADGDVKI